MVTDYFIRADQVRAGDVVVIDTPGPTVVITEVHRNSRDAEYGTSVCLVYGDETRRRPADHRVALISRRAS